MATRAIKKLTKGDELKKLAEIDDQNDDASDSDTPVGPVNKFDLVNRLTHTLLACALIGN